MNIIGKPDVYEKPLQSWYDRVIAPLVDTSPEIGDLRIKWYTAEALAEENGELVTIEKWDGYGWNQFGLDVNDTVQDLLDLSWKLEDENEVEKSYEKAEFIRDMNREDGYEY